MIQSYYKIVIIGRPNVGKSSLYNALLGYRRAIVSPESGTTLDKIREKVVWDGRPLEITDSQGILEEADEKVLKDLVDQADAILFVVDAIAGVTPYDRWLNEFIQRSDKPRLLVMNKSDSGHGSNLAEFAELRIEEMVAVSAVHRKNLEEIKDWCADISEEAEDLLPITPAAPVELSEDGEPILPAPLELEKPALKIALVGRPNTGKSTLMNRLCQEQVSRVSPIALTTRDPVSGEIRTKDGLVRILDTAGMRRPRSKKGSIEVFSIHAATRAIRDSDVVLLLIASHEPVADQDVRLLNLLVRENKPTIVLFNFWDKLNRKQQREFYENSEFEAFLESFQQLEISGKTGNNIPKILPLAYRLARSAKKRVPTAELNRFVERIVDKNPPPQAGKGNFNILYASQVGVEPPTFVFFMNRKGSLPASYHKYVENQIRNVFRLKGQPIRLYFRGGENRAPRA